MSKGIAYVPDVTAQIAVSDFKRSVKWYSEVLGFQPQFLMEEMGFGMLDTGLPGLTVGLNAGDGATGGGAIQLVFTVEDIDAARAALEAQGVKFDGPTEEIPGMVRLATFRDPDNNALRFAQSLR